MGQARRNLLIGGSILGVCALGGLLPSFCAMRQLNRKPAKPMTGAPKRPEGKAKPLLEEDIAPVLGRLSDRYGRRPERQA